MGTPHSSPTSSLTLYSARCYIHLRMLVVLSHCIFTRTTLCVPLSKMLTPSLGFDAHIFCIFTSHIKIFTSHIEIFTGHIKISSHLDLTFRAAVQFTVAEMSLQSKRALRWPEVLPQKRGSKTFNVYLSLSDILKVVCHFSSTWHKKVKSLLLSDYIATVPVAGVSNSVSTISKKPLDTAALHCNALW